MAKSWRKNQVDQAKTKVKQALADALEQSGESGRLQAIQKGIQALQKEESVPARIELFVYCMSGLVHYERYGFSKWSAVNNLVQLATSILRAAEINPEYSKLSFLYAEVYLVQSQIFRKHGDHWSAAWAQHASHLVTKRDPLGGRAFQNLSRALRTLRLGHSHMARVLLLEALEDPELGTRSRILCQLALARCARLSGDREQAHQAIEACRSLDPEPEALAEAEWEELQLTPDPQHRVMGLIASIRSHEPHFKPVYIMECFLWAAAVNNELLEKMPFTMRYMIRKKELDIKGQKQFHDYCLAVEALRDYSVPFTFRVERIGEKVKSVGELITIDKEILFLAAVARWLIESRSYYLAHLVLGSYINQSRQLSGGASTDVLGVFPDLDERAWFDAPAKYIVA